jgi:hypothetical protein
VLAPLAKNRASMKAMFPLPAPNMMTDPSRARETIQRSARRLASQVWGYGQDCSQCAVIKSKWGFLERNEGRHFLAFSMIWSRHGAMTGKLGGAGSVNDGVLGEAVLGIKVGRGSG